MLFFYLLLVYPWQTIAITIVLAGMYFVIRRIGNDNDLNSSMTHRRAALREAKIYLAPYSDIWRNLKLSNTHCTLRLGPDGTTITARDSKNNTRSFKVIRSNVYSNPVLWDMFCVGFSHDTTFDRLIELCKTYNADIKLEGEEYTLSQGSSYSVSVANNQSSREVKIDINTEKYQDEKKEKVDINNASEVELTALPGVSIVLAKKIIKKREEIGGFKDVNEVLQFIQLKPHMRLQLRELICVKKMKGSVNIKRHNERSVDL